MSLPPLLRPDHCVASVLDLDVALLQSWRVRGLLMDADNTLVARHAYRLDQRTHDWLASLLAAEIKLAIVSNSASPRQVAAMVTALGIPTIALARKPARAGFRRALRMLDLPAQDVAMVGDQLFTDIVGGNRMGLRTILVPPCSNNDFIVYRLFGRTLERPLLRRHQQAQRAAALRPAEPRD